MRFIGILAAGATALSGIVALSDAEAEFHPAADFWASSTLAVAPDTIRCPTIDANRLIRDFAPTVLVMDIEGGELGVLTQPLPGVRLVVVETHPLVYGAEGVARITAALEAQGFVPADGAKKDTLAFLRSGGTGAGSAPTGRMAASSIPPSRFTCAIQAD